MTDAQPEATADVTRENWGLRPGAWRWIVGGIAITLLHLSIVYTVDSNAAAHLCTWDCEWYVAIAKDGYLNGPDVQIPVVGRPPTGMESYVNRIHSNVTVFPGFPLLVRAVAAAGQVPASRAVLPAAWLCAMGTWIYWLGLTRRTQVPGSSLAVPTLLLLAYPGTFYLIAGYSESLFIMSILGFVYWTDRAVESRERTWLFWSLVIAHGVLVTATRLVGIGVLVYPLLRVWADQQYALRIDRRILFAGLVGLLGLAGVIAFGVYCQVAFGQWYLYFTTERSGWATEHVRWNAGQGLFDRPGFWDLFQVGLNVKQPDQISRLVTWTILIAVGLKLWQALRKRPAERTAVPLLATAFALAALTAAVRVDVGFKSMLRYLLPAIFLGMAGLVAAEQSVPGKWLRLRQPNPWLGWILVAWMMALQIALMLRYMAEKFVS